MEKENKTKHYEEYFHNDLYHYLLSLALIDSHFPEAPDIEDCWAKIGESYMPDAMREFNKYPTVALGWIMYVGMAVAEYWDQDFELYSKVPGCTSISATATATTIWTHTSARRFSYLTSMA